MTQSSFTFYTIDNLNVFNATCMHALLQRLGYSMTLDISHMNKDFYNKIIKSNYVITLYFLIYNNNKYMQIK